MNPSTNISQQAEDESFEFDYTLKTIIPSLSFKNIKASSLKINTMTVVCKPSLASLKFSIPDLKNILIEKQKRGELEEGMTLSTKCLGKNCIIFKWIQKIEGIDSSSHDKETRNISIKVFGNGSIHIVGVTRPIYALLISNYFLNFFEDIQRRGNVIPSTDPSCLTGMTETYSICMIQSNFEVDRAILLKEFREKWDVVSGSIVYNKDSRHPGLQIKFKELSTSCILFSSGKILITGATEADHLENVYKIVCEFIDKNFECVTKQCVVVEKKIPGKRGRKRKAEHDAFYEEFDIEKELQ